MKELFHNALDACQDAQNLHSEILIQVNELQPNVFQVKATDSGCGIPGEDMIDAVARAFSSRRIDGTALTGKFGIGLKMIALVFVIHLRMLN